MEVEPAVTAHAPARHVRARVHATNLKKRSWRRVETHRHACYAPERGLWFKALDHRQHCAAAPVLGRLGKRTSGDCAHREPQVALSVGLRVTRAGSRARVVTPPRTVGEHLRRAARVAGLGAAPAARTPCLRGASLWARSTGWQHDAVRTRATKVRTAQEYPAHEVIVPLLRPLLRTLDS